MNTQTFNSLASLAMDLKRVALGLHRGSGRMAERFFQEARERRGELDLNSVEPYIQKLLINLDRFVQEKDMQKNAEDFLMYSVLLQNYVRSNYQLK